MRIYYYKLTTDDLGAPCVQDKLLSLAICKPMIRSTAEKGDLIFGFAADSLRADNPLIYIARVTKKLAGIDYYGNPEYADREDCIYGLKDGQFFWKPGSMHHGPDDLHHDIGGTSDNVLLSNDFRYFGYYAESNYKDESHWIKEAVEKLTQGHRVNHREELTRDLIELAKNEWEKAPRKSVRPMSKPTLAACHRNDPCDFIEANDLYQGTRC